MTIVFSLGDPPGYCAQDSTSKLLWRRRVKSTPWEENDHDEAPYGTGTADAGPRRVRQALPPVVLRPGIPEGGGGHRPHRGDRVGGLRQGSQGAAHGESRAG